MQFFFSKPTFDHQLHKWTRLRESHNKRLCDILIECSLLRLLPRNIENRKIESLVIMYLKNLIILGCFEYTAPKCMQYWDRCQIP